MHHIKQDIISILEENKSFINNDNNYSFLGIDRKEAHNKRGPLSILYSIFLPPHLVSSHLISYGNSQIQRSFSLSIFWRLNHKLKINRIRVIDHLQGISHPAHLWQGSNQVGAG